MNAEDKRNAERKEKCDRGSGEEKAAGRGEIKLSLRLDERTQAEEIVRRLKSKGLRLEEIADITGVSVDKIRKL